MQKSRLVGFARHDAPPWRADDDHIAVVINGVPLYVLGFYQASEKPWWSRERHNGHPGCNESFEPSAAYVAGSEFDILELLDADELAEAVLEKIRDDNERSMEDAA